VSDLAKQYSDERDVKRDLLQCQNRPTTMSDLAKQYSDERDKNRVMPKDRGKIFDFNPESVNWWRKLMKKIDGIVNTDKKKQVEEKALAACYALQARLLCLTGSKTLRNWKIKNVLKKKKNVLKKPYRLQDAERIFNIWLLLVWMLNSVK
jgi:hypothetical protein